MTYSDFIAEAMRFLLEKDKLFQSFILDAEMSYNTNEFSDSVSREQNRQEVFEALEKWFIELQDKLILLFQAFDEEYPPKEVSGCFYPFKCECDGCKKRHG